MRNLVHLAFATLLAATTLACPAADSNGTDDTGVTDTGADTAPDTEDAGDEEDVMSPPGDTGTDATSQDTGPDTAADSGTADSGDEPDVGGDDNPDGWPTATAEWASKDYEAEDSEDVLLTGTPIVDFTYGDYGYDGSGGWRAEPNYDDVNEDNAGWTGGGRPPQGEKLVVKSYLLKFTEDFIQETAAGNGTAFKWEEAWQGNADFNERSGDSSHRWVAFLDHQSDDTVRFSLTAGGAGDGTFYDDGSGTNPDLLDLAGEWVWWVWVYDAESLRFALYYKREGDTSVTKAVELNADNDENLSTCPPDCLEDAGQGWLEYSLTPSYWDDLNNGTKEAGEEHYMYVDRLRIGNGWPADGAPF